jgi:glycosyl hydrolase family 10
MGTMIFQLPVPLADETCRQELERSSVTGGQDNMPFPTDTCIDEERLTLQRCVNETGSMQVQVPWQIDGFGQLMVGSATLMERSAPYHLGIELARGKLNQVRTHASEWTMGGLLMPDTLAEEIRAATKAFGHAVMRQSDVEATPLAQQALKLAFEAGHQLARIYTERVFDLRHQRQKKIEASLSCRLEGGEPSDELTSHFKKAFNSVSLPFHWRDVEPEHRRFAWDESDRVTNWAHNQGLKVIGGPLIDFAGRNLPDWLWECATDLTSLSNYLADYVETVVRRYQSRIKTWQITSGSNCAGVLARHDAELIWLTLRLADAVRRVNPQLEIIVGLAQPWGDYLAEQERSKTPFIFADDLLRTGVRLAGLDLELLMGISPRGSYCRDLLDTSRLLDLYALLGVPIQATLGYPSARTACASACPDQRVNLGNWRGGHTESSQADWASVFAAMALCKPFVRTVQWAHWSDTQPHFFPHGGLINSQGRPKPALQELARLRSEHLN